jgi:hypothetical protein
LANAGGLAPPPAVLETAGLTTYTRQTQSLF